MIPAIERFSARGRSPSRPTTPAGGAVIATSIFFASIAPTVSPSRTDRGTTRANGTANGRSWPCRPSLRGHPADRSVGDLRTGRAGYAHSHVHPQRATVSDAGAWALDRQGGPRFPSSTRCSSTWRRPRRFGSPTARWCRRLSPSARVIRRSGREWQASHRLPPQLGGAPPAGRIFLGAETDRDSVRSPTTFDDGVTFTNRPSNRSAPADFASTGCARLVHATERPCP